MANLKIRVFKDGSIDPSSTVTIPGTIVRLTSGLIPRKAREAMQEEGIDLEEIAKLTENPENLGEIARIEDHEKDELVVIALE